MAGLVAENIIEQIRENADIVEIASGYINLKKTGRNYKALCPFHVEKTPSFIVNSEKQIFHCFGCGVGGNVFNLVMKMENITFIESVK
ncbi:DNA primase, partial [Candidatus Desantisbacteria bacterium CG_4_10_14_0_8_um_filter_39_17]